jgi:hypothetical protein
MCSATERTTPVPARERSLAITDAYRARRLELVAAARAATARDWRELVDVGDLDATHPAWVDRAATTLTAVQSGLVRLTSAYLIAFLRSELGRPVDARHLDERALVGVTRSGKPMTETLAATVIGVKQAIGEGVEPAEAAARGSRASSRLVAAEASYAAQGALSGEIQGDDRIVGWERVTSGGCGACLAAATRTYGAEEPFAVHDGCQCSAEPVIAGTRQRAPRASGYEIFAGMTPAAQDALLGTTKAELVRSGTVVLTDLLDVSPMAAIDDQITETPLKALV